MENPTVKETRTRTYIGAVPEDVRPHVSGSGEELQDQRPVDVGTESAPEVADSGHDERDFETRLREDPEFKREALAQIDALEIVDGAETTTQFRRAMALFDPEDTDVQAAESWSYRDAEYERDGRI